MRSIFTRTRIINSIMVFMGFTWFAIAFILNLDNSLLIGGGLTICVIYLAATYVYYRSKFKNSKKAKRSRKKSKKR